MHICPQQSATGSDAHSTFPCAYAADRHHLSSPVITLKLPSCSSRVTIGCIGHQQDLTVALVRSANCVDSCPPAAISFLASSVVSVQPRPHHIARSPDAPTMTMTTRAVLLHVLLAAMIAAPSATAASTAQMFPMANCGVTATTSDSDNCDSLRCARLASFHCRHRVYRRASCVCSASDNLAVIIHSYGTRALATDV